MRVDMVVAELDPFSGRSLSQHVLTQARGLVSRGMRVRVVCASAAQGSAEKLERLGLELREVSLGRGPQPAGLGLQPAPEELVAALAEADVVHLHLGVPLASDLVRRLDTLTRVCLELHDWHAICARGQRVPFDDRGPLGVRLECPTGADPEPCVTCLSPAQEAATAAAANPAALELDRARLRRALAQRQAELAAELRAAGRVLVPSRTHLVRLAEHVDFVPARVRIVTPNQGRLPGGQPAQRSPWRGDGPLRLLHLGPRESRAGLVDLVRGLAVLPEGRVQLVLAGAELEPGLDQRLRQLAGSLSLEFSAQPGPKDLRRQAARCHLAVLPSRVQEGYPVGVDEALAFGLPVLACHAEAAAERYGSEGLMQLPPRDPNAWTTLVGQLLRRPGELAALAQGLPAEVPGPEALAERLSSLYLNHAGPGRTRAS